MRRIAEPTVKGFGFVTEVIISAVAPIQRASNLTGGGENNPTL